MLAVARNTPNSPPKMDSSKPSVNNCRIVRSRDAPRAARTPNSLWRSAVRLRKSVATFTHAISKTNVTAAKEYDETHAQIASRQPYELRLQVNFGLGACPSNSRREEAHDTNHRIPGILCVFALRRNEHPELR